MIKVKIENLRGNEILAKHILNEDTGKELIAMGTMLKKEYIERLKTFNISEVYVVDASYHEKKDEFNLIAEVVKEESIVLVKEVMEKHIYKNTVDLEKLCEVADDIINNVMTEKEVINQVTTIRQSSGDLYSHSINVCALSTVLALKNGFSKEIVSDIAKGALLHDIGLRYMLIPYENQDINKLPMKNQIELKKHVVYGYEAVQNVDWLSDLSKNIILLHHERNDGSGYPFKNHGSSIRDAIKIVAVCDMFDSLISGIGYESMKVYEAIEYMRQLSVKALNKNYVDSLLEMVALYPVGTKVVLSTNEEAVVVSQNNNEIDRPIVQILKDANERIVSNEVIVDLMKNLTVFINGVVEDDTAEDNIEEDFDDTAKGTIGENI